MKHHDMIIQGTRPGGLGTRAPEVPADWPDFYYDARRPCAPASGISALWTSSETADLNDAANLCRRRCPFTAECLAQAIKLHEDHHVWGGYVLSRREDRRRALRQAASADMRALRQAVVA